MPDDYRHEVVMRRRKRHIQLELPKLDKNGQRRGGRRPGAGRKPKGVRAGAPHKRRPQIDARHPQHVVLRTTREIGWLRKPHAYRAIRRALVIVHERHDDFRIVHFSVQSNHIHLLCEATGKYALASGVQGFQISAARHLNAEAKRSGTVFPDRYHAESIDSVRQVRHALAYILNNWRKHKQDRGRAWIDPFSSGFCFAGWKQRVSAPADFERPAVAQPETWLAAEGWKRAAPISVYEMPGPGG